MRAEPIRETSSILETDCRPDRCHGTRDGHFVIMTPPLQLKGYLVMRLPVRPIISTLLLVCACFYQRASCEAKPRASLFKYTEIQAGACIPPILDLRLPSTAYSRGSIRGVVKVENGTLPASGRLVIALSRVGDANARTGGGTAADARGHFLIEGLAAGTYELVVFAFVPEWRQRRPTTKQLVTVADAAATDVVITIDLTPPPVPLKPSGSGQ